MDPIDVEPLNSALPTMRVPYGTSEDEVLATKRLEQKGSSPWRIKTPKV